MRGSSCGCFEQGLRTPDFPNQLFQSLTVQLALPHREDTPPELAKFCDPSDVALPVGVEFRFPECSVLLRHHRHATTRMLVPEAPMDEDNRSMTAQYQIRTTWE